MRYYKMIRDDKLLYIGIGPGGIEITEDEYNVLLQEIRTKTTLIEKLYTNEITIEDVPEQFRNEIQRRVNKRIEDQGVFEEQDISSEEALDIILGGEV